MPKPPPAWIWVTCPTCKGSGTRGMDKHGPKTCPLCNGRGEIKVPNPYYG